MLMCCPDISSSGLETDLSTRIVSTYLNTVEKAPPVQCVLDPLKIETLDLLNPERQNAQSSTMAMKRTVPSLSTSKKYYESSAIFSKFISDENIAKVLIFPFPPGTFRCIYCAIIVNRLTFYLLCFLRLQLKKVFFFRPDDPHNLHQTPPASFKMPGVDRIKGYRYPAPG